MSRVNQGIVLLLAALILITIGRLLIPYNLPESKTLLPEVHIPNSGGEGREYLMSVLENNMFDEERKPLSIKDGDTEVRVDSQNSNALDNANRNPGDMRLVGVSLGEGQIFAMIESDKQMERFEPGEMLPDGSRLEEVIDYGIRISKAGEDERIYLFGKE